MADQLGIWNLALVRLGEEPAASLTDTSKRALALAAVYEVVRDEVLADYPWNFATVREHLTIQGPPPEFHYRYAYPLPGQALRFWGICDPRTGEVNPELKYRLEEGMVLTNFQVNGALPVKYTVQITDEAQFSIGFVSALALRLAAEVCYRLTKNAAALKQGLLGEYQALLAKAKGKDAQEAGTPNVQVSNTWADARR